MLPIFKGLHKVCITSKGSYLLDHKLKLGHGSALIKKAENATQFF